MAYLKEVSDHGVLNMEMEALVFAALTHISGIKAAVVCVTLLDRLKGDQVINYPIYNLIKPVYVLNSD